MEEITTTEDLLMYTPPFGGRPASSLDLLSTTVANSPPLLPAFPERLHYDAVLTHTSSKEIVGDLGSGSTSSGVQCLSSSLLLPASTGTSKGLDICSWIDVFVSATETNPCVRRTKKGKMLLNVPCSRLVSIFYVASQDAFRWPAEAIVVAKGKHDILVANGTAKVMDPRTSLPTRFVMLRFLNILFGKEIRPLLVNRGKIPERNQLQDKLKTDE
eukprot:190343-Ditylum_brightwellii.AAC.1